MRFDNRIISGLGRIGMYWCFALGLREYLKEPVTLSQYRSIIEERLAKRQDNFLKTVKHAVYENKKSPYLRLFRIAGCEYRDLEKMVRNEGVETALDRLAGEGVYFTIEEFKGKREALRSGQVLTFREADFDNPGQTGHIEARTGATRSAGTRTIYDLNHLAEKWAVHQILRLDACNALNLPVVIWQPIMPGAGPLALLAYAKGGIIPRKWFSPVEKAGFRPSLKNRLATSFIVRAGRVFRAEFPMPEYVELDDALRVARWMGNTIQSHGGCYSAMYVSNAVRVSRAARENGIDLTGAIFSVSSEPFTGAKKKEIEASGAKVFPMYAFMEAGIVGLACCNPASIDDYHLLDECTALTRRRRKVSYADAGVDAFLFSSLLPSSPKVLINVETGDYGNVRQRSCGCKLEEMGFRTHIDNIRSFDKLTGEGMNFIAADIARIVEEVLPARFGGSSTSYQFIEEEGEGGRTLISLVISPELVQIDDKEVKRTVLAELGRDNDVRRMMTDIWSQADILRVKRMKPVPTARGKLMPLHIMKKPQ